MARIPLLAALFTTALFLAPAWAQVQVQVQESDQDSERLAQLKFTAVEYLIYTDQLQKLDATPCGASTASRHNLSEARQEILQAAPEQYRAELERLFVSPQVQQLLEENSQGIASVLGAPGLAGMPNQLNAEQRQACLEYALVFEQNLEATRKDLEALLNNDLSR